MEKNSHWIWWLVKILNKFGHIFVNEIGDKIISKFVPKIITKCNTKFNNLFGDTLREASKLR